MIKQSYKAVVSSDWNECLAPTGPFDPVLLHHPELTPQLSAIFKRYTGNEIPLSRALQELQSHVPDDLSPGQIDAYLERSFATYKGVSEFITWCGEQDILFMINTTAWYGVLQRVLTKNLLPPVSAVSAHPMLCFPKSPTDPDRFYPLLEIEDKGANTEQAMADFGIPSGKLVVIGDSGGDGPHFAWAKSRGGLLIGSRPKPSLEVFCRNHGLEIDFRIGRADREKAEREPEPDFMDCVPKIEGFLNL